MTHGIHRLLIIVVKILILVVNRDFVAVFPFDVDVLLLHVEVHKSILRSSLEAELLRVLNGGLNRREHV